MKLTQAFTLLSLLTVPILAQNYTNPLLWEDFADPDVFRVNDTYYYTASTMHYSPGAPILRSYDLVNWEFIGHAVPTLDWSSPYNLANGERAYVRGIWASALNYRKSNGLYYFVACIDFWFSYIYTAPSPTGPWTRRTQIQNCYYDSGLLIDDDDTMYVSYGAGTINVAQLSVDGLSQVKAQAVYTPPAEIGAVEGSKFYKINGQYYIFVTRPGDAQFVLKSSSPWGPYTIKPLAIQIAPPTLGANPRQGSMVQTQNGAWYWMAHMDVYPGGRIPVLAPLTWGSDGFPIVTTINGGFGASYPNPLPRRPTPSFEGTDNFSGTSLSPQWEWNHNPDTTKFTVNNGLTLRTATQTNDLYAARNTLTHRVIGPKSTATIVLNYANMKPGDRAGLAMFRESSAWVGVKNDNGVFRVAMTSDITMNTTWVTTNTGSEKASTALPTGTSKIWLRIAGDFSPGVQSQANFFYSTNGSTFTRIGTPLTLSDDYRYFIGYRYGIFNYGTTQLGGSVLVSSFTMTKGI